MSDLIEQIEALLSLDARNALVPHGIGGLARELLTRALTELQHRRAEPAFWHNGQRQMITNAVKVGKPVDEDDARWISRFDQPLYAASPSSPASGVRVKAPDTDMARHWIDRYAAGIDEEPQMSRILAALGLSALGEHP